LIIINYSPRHEDVWGNGGIVPPLLTSRLRCRASRPAALPLREQTQVLIGLEARWGQRWSVRYGERTIFCTLWWCHEVRFIAPVVSEESVSFMIKIQRCHLVTHLQGPPEHPVLSCVGWICLFLTCSSWNMSLHSFVNNPLGSTFQEPAFFMATTLQTPDLLSLNSVATFLILINHYFLALCYKPEGHECDVQWDQVDWQALTEMNTSNIHGVKWRPVH
jgi:hypothetical protein